MFVPSVNKNSSSLHQTSKPVSSEQKQSGVNKESSLATERKVTPLFNTSHQEGGLSLSHTHSHTLPCENLVSGSKRTVSTVLHHLILKINLRLKDEEDWNRHHLLLLLVCQRPRQSARPPPALYWCNWGDESDGFMYDHE